MKPRYFFIGVIVFILISLPYVSWSQTINRDSVYFRNFAYHQDNSACKHVPPSASFIFFLNRNLDHILIENAPRWAVSADPNFDGKGSFGVELANFQNPGVAVNDSVFGLYTCVTTQQQGLVSSRVSTIPWVYFPKSLHLVSKNIPDVPQNLTLNVDSNKVRALSWSAAEGVLYSVYRRDIQDTIGLYPRKMYTRIADSVSTGSFIDTSVQKEKLYGYIIIPKDSSGNMGAHSEEVNEAPKINYGDDIDAAWIARLPRYDYEWGSTDPSVDGWPRAGQTVTWQAVVRNWFNDTLPDVKYKWYLDSVCVDSGFVTLAADTFSTVNYSWVWTFERHEIKFVIDPDATIPEEEEFNNEISIYTNSIAVGFYVEQSMYNYFRQYQRSLNVHSNSWEDWAQRHVKRWNFMFANAFYPEAPNGVQDRIRLDKVTIVPDGSLPLVSGWLPTNAPNANDRTIDLQWGFVSEGLSGSFYSDHKNINDNNPFYFEGSLFHELGHARYLIDVYGFNVHDDGNGSTIGIRENGQLATSLGLIPENYYTSIRGLMNSQYTYIDRYSAACLNLITGHRAIYGNYNAPNNIGVFMDDLPAKNIFLVKDSQGNILSNASIKIYQSTGNAGQWYGKYYDDLPDLVLSTDSSGFVNVGRCPFSSDGFMEHTYGKSNAVMIIRVEKDGKVGYAFFESMWFNLQYWTGNVLSANYEIPVEMKILTDVESFAGNVPTEFILEQNYPNPFNPSTVIRYQLPKSGSVELRIYNMLGQEVETLVNTAQSAGIHSVEWKKPNSASGVYYYQLKACGKSSVKKMLLLK